MSLRPTSGSLTSLVLLLAALSLTACDRGYTIHKIIDDSVPSGDVAALDGLWITGDADDYWVLRISRPGLGQRECQEAWIRVWKSSDSFEEPPMMEGSVCMAEVAGQTLAELMTPGEPALYQHFLVRTTRERIAVCGGVSVWALFKGSPDGDAPGFSLEGLDYATRRNGEAEDIFVTSGPEQLDAYLGRNLPRLAEVCDKSKEGDPTPGWLVFERVTPAPSDAPPAPAEAADLPDPQR